MFNFLCGEAKQGERLKRRRSGSLVLSSAERNLLATGQAASFLTVAVAVLLELEMALPYYSTYQLRDSFPMFFEMPKVLKNARKCLISPCFPKKLWIFQL